MSLQYPPFTSFDIAVLKSILSREPTKKELDFIGPALKPLISSRYFIDFSQKHPFYQALNKTQFDNEHGLKYSCSNISDISILNMLLTQKAAHKNISCITVNYNDNNSILSVQGLLKKINEIDFLPSSVLIGNYHLRDDFENKDFIYSIGTGKRKDSAINIIPIDSSVYLVKHESKSTVKQFKQMYRLIHEINMNSKKFSIILLNGYTPIFTLLSTVMDQEGGLDLQFNRESDIYDILFHSPDFGLIVFGNKGIFQKIRSINENQFQVIKLGRYTDQDSLIVNVRNNHHFFFPKNTFSFLWRSDNTVSSIQDERTQDISEFRSLKKLKGNESFITILKHIYLENKLYKINHDNLCEEKITNNVVSWKDRNINGTLTISFSEYNHFSKIYPKSAGKIAFSNAVRSVRCVGADPIGVMIQNTFSTNPESLADSVSLNQSQEIAIEHFKLSVISKSINLDSETISQDISVIGKIPDKGTILFPGFKQIGHFISILGSHRGDLTGSVFQQCFPKKVENQFVTIDLTMESKLGEVLQLGIESNLIQTATNVGRGGLSTAIVSNLVNCTNEFGARIHLSRKLKSEELLFGETHGLILISLREEDIMEFERICMNIGVPCTTIGRVTNTGRLTFNDLIDISTVKLKNIYEKQTS